MRCNLALIGPEAALLEEMPRYSEAGPGDPAGVGVGGTGVSDVPGRRCHGDGPRYPPTPAPWASGARFAGIWDLALVAPSGWVVPGIATLVHPGITHPVYPPWYTQPARMSGLVHTTSGVRDHWDMHIWPF